ncbi:MULTISPECIES: 30S ribosomal protein S17 [Stigmatella]|jgi:small subunit ribosomal protein S17|uniref:Small ribosomal subunit protein uS17 n=3 Tax=Stigmatella TaxID=40 RepID=A0A1H7WAE3_STIAU|nr:MULTISPECIES: 30S ribosomal protein S17 [Stigmatella]MDC0707298.1 30S ribosomal protein S17 [Stigmatella ashevillena]SEM17968.1 SSU ribosomal protein S17P [Stigmatella aurantiaca]SET03687.1 SSU ribosomal protein S17P [Stigmatella erecta]
MAEATQTTSAPATSTRGRPKTRVGIVTSNKMQKTVVVTVQRRAAHPKYGKIMSMREKYKAHVEDHDYPKKITINEGDRVRIAETRPASKDKRWRVVEVIEKSKNV